MRTCYKDVAKYLDLAALLSFCQLGMMPLVNQVVVELPNVNILFKLSRNPIISCSK